ncbi:DDT domain-containing protein PTM isoform X2 [Humulus lupulus]|uniref:DDT domain-containing protein PTM isoform X2 n=1 Tax=Humulus lupulus TaxID=3486 RepID=UPI002B403CD1|nr:DDT domain-containing protein PTM isoform X2 [Humulus lupulus]XP_062082238.1 DDT domain-containing protein PTM isoform X2 [Humulus lupulus]
MEFVGRAVTREIEGRGVLSGLVKSYESSSGLFEVVYEDGDSEELDLAEVSLLVGGEVQLVEVDEDGVKSSQQDRKLNKRRRLEGCGEAPGDSGNAGQNIVIDGTLGNDGGVGRDLNENCDILNDGKEGSLKMGHGVGGNLELNGDLNGNDSSASEFEKTLPEKEGLEDSVSVSGDLKDGFDLNAAFNLNLNDDSNLYFNPEENLKKLDHIDLNLDVNGDFDENLNSGDFHRSSLGTQRKGCNFDLNLEVVEDVKEAEGEGDRQVTSLEIVGDGQTKEGDEVVEEKFVEEDIGLNGNLTKVHLDMNEDINVASVKDVCTGSAELVTNECSGSMQDRKAVASAVVLDTNSAGDCGLTEVQVRDGYSEAGIQMINEHLDNSGSPLSKMGGRRKRKKLSDNIKSPSETVLRRSARRGSAQNHISITLCTVTDTPSSPAVSAITEEKPGTSVGKVSEKPCVPLPPKLQLPPSSQNIDLSDIPILDLFSVYAFLRSFSTLLFLSPFEVEDFVAALKCKCPSSLFDNVHVSILQTLRKHLEYLSNEGSESASDCLRSLNWEFLDLITWPVFMVEYFVIHGSGLKPSFDLSSLQLFKADYYQQPASIKVEMLRCLCDDLIEVETIRSELNRRSLAAEPDMVCERNFNFEGSKKRRVALGISSGSCLDDKVIDDAVDWNYDECCLCKMDGNLICCDGCPAAYHSRCVGVANDHLPEGDWYCPECVIDRHSPWMKPRKSLRGAELLGIDPHGRLYFNSAGYLLVSDSYDTESSFSYYHRDDLNVVIKVLKSSDFYYGDILVAICKHWGNVSLDGSSKSIECLYSMSSYMFTKSQNHDLSNPLAPLTSPETHLVKNESGKERKMEENTNIGDSSHSDISKSFNILDAMTLTGSSLVTSEGSAETQSDIQGKHIAFGDCPLTSTLDVKQEVNTETAGPVKTRNSVTTRKCTTSQSQCGSGYVNYYTFGQIASSVAEDLVGKSSEKMKEGTVMLEEEIISRQMRAILKRFSKFCWSNMKNFNVDLQKEKCGWCFPCRTAADDRECLFFTNTGHVRESPNGSMLSLQSMKNRDSHLIDVVYQILSIENRLHGLLLGPWLNPDHTKLWPKSALKAADITSVKHMLLTLESNLGRLALSTEWLKYVDSDVSVGSASHIVTSSARGSSKLMIARKRHKFSDIEPGPTLNTASGLGIFWWRGGRLSRKIFNWKVLPHSLVSKAARQGGCTKIQGILYPENSEYAKRSKYVVWQGAVETSTSAEQLAFQVRELDSNIKWDDIENTHSLPALDKESRKSIRLFKKVIIRRKCIQGGLVKYLLDFGGKRRAIPDVVKKHGSVIEESSSERKKYWLDESYVPLHLLKNFEEKRVARKANDLKSGKVVESGRVRKRPPEKRGFAYLFAKAERSEYYQCGHCSKDVLIREAVSCQYCKGFFHKRHVRKSAGAIIAKCTYTCHRCQNGICVSIDTKKGKTDKRGAKVKSQKSKSVQKDGRSSRLKGSKKKSIGGLQVQSKGKTKATPAVPLRRSARRAKCVLLQNKKNRGRRKGKQTKSKAKLKKAVHEKPKKVIPYRKKRTYVSHSYWLNGLQLTRNLDDERVLLFRDKIFISPTEQSHILPDPPKCQLCDEAGHTSTLSYIACQICGEWFHGDGFGLQTENIDKVIGFRCHTCRESAPPVCPQLIIARTDTSQLSEVQNSVAVECTEEVSNAAPPVSELQVACN